MAWMDNTGLYQKYGLEQVANQVAGEYRYNGPVRCIEIDLDLTTLTTTAGTVIPGTDSVNFPAGFVVDKIEVFTETVATSGGAATLNLGLVRQDRSTEIDNDGFIAALALTAMDAAGETTVLTKGSTGAGALIGATVGSNPGYLAANAGTAVYTAGRVKIRIYYHKP